MTFLEMRVSARRKAAEWEKINAAPVNPALKVS